MDEAGCNCRKLRTRGRRERPHTRQSLHIEGASCAAKRRSAQAEGAHTLLRLTPRQHERFESFLLAHGASRLKRVGGIAGKLKALMKALGQLRPPNRRMTRCLL